MGAPRLTLGGPGREAQADRQFDGKDLDGRKLGRKFVRELCGNGHDAAAWMPREWFVLAQRAGAWELRLRPGTDAIGLLRAGDERRQTQVVRPGETQRLRDGDRLIFAMPEEEGGGLFGYVDVRLDERLDERRRKRERPQVAAAPGPAKRPRTDCCTCAKQHAGACHCGSTGHCAWCRRCDHCRKAESPAAPGDCPRGGGAWGAGGPAFPARAPRAECLPKTAETLRCEVCDKKYPENPPNLPLVRMLEEMEKYERAFNGEDKRWRPGERPAAYRGQQGGSNQDSYVNGRALGLRHAAASVRSYDKMICTEADLAEFKDTGQKTYIGESLEVQVKEFIRRSAQTDDGAAAERAGQATPGELMGCSIDAGSPDQPGDWTPAADRHLQTLTSFETRPGQWAEKARLLGGRDPRDVRDRWRYSCEKLDKMRADNLIQNSKGETRYDDLGNNRLVRNCASLARLQKIIGVGYKQSHTWLEKHNLRSLADVRRAAEAGTIRLKPDQKDGVGHYESIRIIPLVRKEIEEMQRVVREALQRVAEADPRRFAGFSPDGWRVLAGGGYRRGNEKFHDADFLISHPALRFGSAVEGSDGHSTLLELVLQELSNHHQVHGGYRMGDQIKPRLLKDQVKGFGADSDSDDEGNKEDERFKRPMSYGSAGGSAPFQSGTDGFMMWQTRRMEGTYLKLLRSSADADRGFENMDCLDRFFGIWHWPKGPMHPDRDAYVRRVDLVVVPIEQWGFATMGWTGSRQWNRSVRDYARRVRGLSLTSHCAVTIEGKLDMMMDVPGDCAVGDTFRAGFDSEGNETTRKVTDADGGSDSAYDEREYVVVNDVDPVEQCGAEKETVTAIRGAPCGKWCGHCGQEHPPALWAMHKATRVIGVGSGEVHTRSAGVHPEAPPDVVAHRRPDGPALGMEHDGPEPERAVMNLLKIPWLPPWDRHA